MAPPNANSQACLDGRGKHLRDVGKTTVASRSGSAPLLEGIRSPIVKHHLALIILLLSWVFVLPSGAAPLSGTRSIGPAGKAAARLVCLIFAVLFASPALALNATWNAATDIPVTAASYTASGTVSFTLNFAPPVGTTLTVVNNTGLPFITGTFSNLAQGQEVTLTFAGVNYPFVANYYGGTGNDLVLQWGNVRPVAWGYNANGQLGNASLTNSPLPVAVVNSGVLAGKTVVAVASGGYHSLALCSDGTLAAWGYNFNGGLGNNITVSSSTPVLVNTASGVSALFGKTVVGIAAGYDHSLALCSDGTVVSWGDNGQLQLGNSSNGKSLVPVAVNMASGSALFGKTVVAVAGGQFFSLALCSDGTVAAWGENVLGQLGTNKTTTSSVPAAVNTVSGVSALYNKTVTAIAAGNYFSIALCSDGTVAAWGGNAVGQLGNNSTTNSLVPVAVNTASGVSALYNKTVTALAAGSDHSIALCSDGTVAAWGYNSAGQLGINSTANSLVPVAVVTSSALAGKTVTAVSAAYSHSLARCSDGTIAAWGSNGSGQLGDNTFTNKLVPVAVNTSTLASGERFQIGVSQADAGHTLSLVASPYTGPNVSTLAATSITTTGATLNGTVNASGSSTAVSFDYGASESYGTTVAGTPTPVTGSSATPVSANLTGLTPGTTYHFRVNGVSTGGNANGNDLTFTTLAQDIAVEQPAGTGIADGGIQSFGNAAVGNPVSLTFTIRNPGIAPLTGLGITFDGTHAAQFSLTAAPVAPVAALAE